VVDRLAIPVHDLLGLGREHHRVRTRPDDSELGPDVIEHGGMLVTAPFGVLDMLFSDDGAAWTVKPGAINQPGLKGLELLAGDDVIVNINDHDRILSLYAASKL